jgi:YVTN family beta-propeller protein
VIDGATNTVIMTIPVGFYPYALVCTPVYNRVYCVNVYSDCVTVLDGVTNSVITTIQVGHHPYALVYNPNNNKIYSANFGSNNITVINGINNTVITTIPAGNSPCIMFYNPTNNKVYCANCYSDNVTVIDGQTDQVITTIQVGKNPCAFCWDSIQNRVYVVNYYSSSISVIRDVMQGVEEEHLTSDAMGTMLELYPNPAKTYLSIRLPHTVNWLEMNIFDATGRLVMSEELSGKNNHISLDGIKNGVYFVSLQSQDQIVIKRLVIIK